MRLTQLIACSFLLMSFSALAIGNSHYTVELNNASGLITVNACFPEDRPRFLTTGRRGSGKYLVLADDSNIRLSRNKQRITLLGECVRYQVDLNLAKADRQARTKNGYWLVNNRSWLWRPPEKTPITIEFKTSHGEPANVSVPWTEDNKTYTAGTTPIGWTSRMLFGNIRHQQVKVGDKQLNIAQTADIPTRKQAEIVDWLTEAASAVAGLYGHFPIDNVQIIVVESGKSREAVPWAEVQRAGNPSIHYFVDASRPINEFKADWTGVHELSHLLIPRVDYNDRWISEGLATYYQNVAKAQAGLLSTKQAWQKLQSGFAKGRRGMRTNLRDSTSTKHVYWGGTAIFLLADLKLQALPTPQSLDQVLAKLYQCCLPSNELWSAVRFMQTLDELSDTTIFSELLSEQAKAPHFPISLENEKQIGVVFQRNYKRG